MLDASLPDSIHPVWNGYKGDLRVAFLLEYVVLPRFRAD